MSAQTDIIEQRKTRNARYAVEDFYAAINKLYATAGAHAMFLIFLIISIALDADNIPHLIFCFLTAAACGVMAAKMSFRARTAIATGAGIYLFLLFLEVVIGGVPDPVSPALAVHKNWEGGELTRVLNALSPYIYLGLRLLFVLPFAMIYDKLTKAEKQPTRYLAKAGFKSADRVS